MGYGAQLAAPSPRRYPTPRTVTIQTLSPNLLRRVLTCVSTVRLEPAQVELLPGDLVDLLADAHLPAARVDVQGPREIVDVLDQDTVRRMTATMQATSSR